MYFISFHLNMTCVDTMFIYIEPKQKSSYMCWSHHNVGNFKVLIQSLFSVEDALEH